MKKVLLTSAAVIVLAMTGFAQDGGKCCKKNANACMTACVKDPKCLDKEKCAKACADATQCKTESKSCCKKAEDKKEPK